MLMAEYSSFLSFFNVIKLILFSAVGSDKCFIVKNRISLKRKSLEED